MLLLPPAPLEALGGKSTGQVVPSRALGFFGKGERCHEHLVTMDNRPELPTALHFHETSPSLG